MDHTEEKKTDTISALEEELELEVETDNLAVPEVHVNEEAQDALDESEEEIDYSGAIPEVHFHKKPTED